MRLPHRRVRVQAVPPMRLFDRAAVGLLWLVVAFNLGRFVRLGWMIRRVRSEKR